MWGTRNLNRRLLGGACAALLLVLAACAATVTQGAGGAWTQTEDGVIVRPAEGPAREVRVRVLAPDIFRVTAAPSERVELPQSLMVVARSENAGFEVAQNRGALMLTTAEAAAEISLATGLVRFRNAAGEWVLAEEERGAFAPVDVGGQRHVSLRQTFNRGTDEGFYGLGQHQNGQFNYNGEDVELAQHNIVDVVPFVVSTRNYGVLWDNNGVSRFGDPEPYRALDAALRVYDESGQLGGFTGRYYQGERALVTRVEADPNFQYLPADEFLRTPPSRGFWPAEFENRSPTRITWEGAIESDTAGAHKFRLYASNYFKLWVDGQLVFDRWRQNWNPWYHNFELELRPGQRRTLRIEWLPNDGYFRLLHRPPMPGADRHSLTLSSEVGRAIDYYFVAGDSMDDVIAGYRRLTGPAVMLPRWAYGFWQSRQRYTRQDELLDVLREYRRRRIPIDNIVLDWFYWPENAWGSHEFDAARFPDPRAMVDEVHRQNAQIMISVWPKFYPTTRNYQELDAGGHIYRRQIEMGARDWVGPGYANAFYDPYSPEARGIYWRQIEERLGVLGFDAWWLDATEPDSHSNLTYPERARRMGPNALGQGAEYFNSFVLPNSQAVFEGEQRRDPDNRAFILTRSTWGGLQRYSSAHWSGDVAARWDDLREQIPAGINMSMSGLPNWTHDIGGFAVEERYTRQDPAHLPEWRELYLRWFQFGAFTPLFRSHGEIPYRETFHIAPQGSEVYNALVYYHRLRYRLLPYIYTIAADTYHKNGTIMRGVVMDFPNDPGARNIGDQYMFGPAFLVSPVTEFRARTRSVYLPAGTRWYDFHTGRAYEGGQRVDAAAPLARMPLFVRAGSIVPIGPAVQHTGENLAGPITLFVYTGADGAFELYEDDGASNGYQRRQFSRIPVRYDEDAGTLTIGARDGEYSGMPVTRTFNVRWIADAEAGADDFEARPDQAVTYAGREIVMRRQ